MFHNIIKRCACFQLAAILLFTLIPVPSFATDTEALDNTAAGLEIEAQANTTVDADEVPKEASEADPIPEAAAPAETVSDNLTIIQDGIDQILGKYSITADMTAQQIEDAVLSMDDVTFEKAVTDCYELEHADTTLSLTEAELAALNEGNAEYAVFASALNTRYTEEYSVSFLASKDLLGGDLTIANNTGTLGTVTDNSYIVKAGGGVFGRQTVTLTITNVSGNKATLAFDYAASNYGSFQIAGSDASASGSYSVTLDADSTLSVVIAGKSVMFAGDASLTLSNISLTAVAAAPKVTFKCDSSLGSISVNNSVVNSGTTQEFTEGTTVAVSATAGNGSTFLGWINESTGEVISKTASFDFEPKNDITLNAVFINSASSAWFLSGGNYMFNDLNAAATKAATLPSKVVIPMFSGTLPAGNYTIPSGVTLLIPFDDSNTSYTTKPGILESFVKPTEFRRLTMADGAHIVVNGSICVSGMHTTQQGYNSSPSGPQGFLEMQQGSSITVESGGNLYAWGYIVGKNRASASAAVSEGTITVKNGGTVYECFQVTDWRGGTDTTAMVDNKYDVFPISQYYIQNVQVPMTLNSGAKEICCMAVVASSVTRQPAIPFFGASSMFNTDGTVTKDYDETTDRIVITTTGNVSFSPITITIEGIMGFIGTTTLESQDYILPLNNNFTIRATTGSITLNQDFAVLPGVEVYVGSGVNVSFSGAYRLFIYDHDNWARFISPSNAYLRAVPYAYNRLKTRTLNDLKDAKLEINGTVDLSAGAVYTTEAGGNICSTGGGQIKTKAGTQTETYQFLQNIDADGNDVYYSIPITPAKLKNGDGSYVQSATATYTYSGSGTDGKWLTGSCSHTWDAGTDFPATCTLPGGTKYTCSSCSTVKYVYNGSANGHTWGAPVNDGKQSCSSYGLETYTCTVCGVNNYVKLPTHTYSNPVFTWNSQTAPTKCTVTLTCSAGDSCSNINPEKGTKVATISGTDSDLEKEIIPGDCKNKGKTIYKAAIRPAVLDPLIPSDTVQIYTDTLEVIGTLGDHKYSDWSLKTPATLTSAAIEARVCSVCKNEETRSVNSAAIGTTEYATLSAALEKAPASVTLLHDISGECTISQPVTIELGDHVADIRAGTGYTCFKEGSTVRIVAVGNPDLSIAATNIKAGDGLDLFFYVPKADLEGTDYKAVINRTKGGKMEDSQEIPYSEWTDYDSTYMRFSYNGIAAKEMTDPVTVTICKENGTPVSYACTETIRGYALRVLSRTDNAELQTALVDMLNYGAAAQDHFNDYNVSNLANTGAEEYQQYATKDDVACTEESKENNKNLQAASVVAESKLIYTFYFANITDSMTATATYTDFYGNEVVRTIEGSKFHPNKVIDNEGNEIPVLGVDVEGLAIADGRQQITCVVMNGDTVAAQAIGSVQGYVATVKRVAENKNTTPDAVFLMLMKFVDSARAYFS